jgi:hypothetical protein
LIRRYKPEHAPEEFKRIREAYELVERLIKSRTVNDRRQDEDQSADEDWGLQDLRPSVPDDEPPFLAEAAAPSEAEPTPAPRGLPLFVPDAETECSEVWRTLCEGGEPADAFAKLVRIHQRCGGSAEACLRLYWLTVAAPQVDSRHGPCHWLTEGLRLSRLEGRLRELYRRELASNPQEAASERCGALLRLEAPVGAVADLAKWRWRALGQIGRWDLLLADLPVLRPRIVYDAEETWGRLLLAAIDQLAWSEAPQAQQAAVVCRQELDSMNHLHGALDRELDRLDLLWEVAAGWRRLRVAVAVPRHWSDLVPLSWTRDYARIRPKLLPVLKEIAQDPFRALGLMDEMARHSAASVAQLGFTIEAYRHAEEQYEYDRRSDQDRATLVGRFIHSHDCSNYRTVRREVLRFCLVETIEPLAFAQIADALTQHLASRGSWQDLLADDGPLRYVYSGYRAFWS